MAYVVPFLILVLIFGTFKLLVDIGAGPGAVSRTIGLTTRADWRPTRMQQRFMDAVERAVGMQAADG